jgi:hypothetical protein
MDPMHPIERNSLITSIIINNQMCEFVISSNVWFQYAFNPFEHCLFVIPRFPLEAIFGVWVIPVEILVSILRFLYIIDDPNIHNITWYTWKNMGIFNRRYILKFTRKHISHPRFRSEGTPKDCQFHRFDLVWSSFPKECH